MAKVTIASLTTQLAEQALLIESLRAALTPAAPTAPTVPDQATEALAKMGVDNVLGTKAFSRPILELIRVDTDWRDDAEYARGIVLDHATCVRRARAWAFERRSYWTTQFGGPIAISQPEFVTAVSGQWPARMGDKVSGIYFAIY